ncbi:MAG: sensor histidine kinase [Actinomycetota bacterium]
MGDIAPVLLLIAAVVLFMTGMFVGRRRSVRPGASAAVVVPPPARGPGAQDVLEHLEEGVVVLNASLTPIVANAAGRRLLGLPTAGLPPSLTPDISSLARRALVEREPADAIVSLHSVDRHLGVRAVAVDEPEGVLIFVRDVTDEQRTHQLRKQFVANASHELKTPVASLQALAEAVGDAASNDPKAVERFGYRLAEEAARLGNLIKDLLDLSRVEDPAAMALHNVDLSEVVRGQVKSVTDDATAKSLQLDPVVEPNVMVRGDEGQLELMVRNLVVNAVRYTPNGGHISVELTCDPDDAVLEVTDDGIGIPLQAQGRVFERFYRVDNDRSRAGGGTGLGLSIVRNTAELHGGTVSLTSVLGEGSTFTVRLPLANGESE